MVIVSVSRLGNVGIYGPGYFPVEYRVKRHVLPTLGSPTIQHLRFSSFFTSVVAISELFEVQFWSLKGRYEEKKLNCHGFLQKPNRFFQPVLAERVTENAVKIFIDNSPVLTEHRHDSSEQQRLEALLQVEQSEKKVNDPVLQISVTV